jgi:hypothetical protein
MFKGTVVIPLKRGFNKIAIVIELEYSSFGSWRSTFLFLLKMQFSFKKTWPEIRRFFHNREHAGNHILFKTRMPNGPTNHLA